MIDPHYRQLIDTTTLASDAAANKRKSWNTKTKIDFEEIQTAHEKFLDNVMRGCLLKSSECVKTMHDILQICLEFCAAMEKLSNDGEWRRHKRRKTAMKTAAEIVNQWTKTDDQTWIDDVNNKQEVKGIHIYLCFALTCGDNRHLMSWWNDFLC